MFSVQTVYLMSCVLLQDNVLNIINQIMDECIPHERANRDFCVKFPEEIRHDNLAGQLWFGAEVGLLHFCCLRLIDTFFCCIKPPVPFQTFLKEVPQKNKLQSEVNKRTCSGWVLREMV